VGFAGVLSGLALLAGSLGCRNETHPPDKEPPVSKQVEKTDAQWRNELLDEPYRILRQKGTEPAFSGAYWNHKEKGVYHCAGCGQPLYTSQAKFDSGTGWPSFTEPIAPVNITTTADHTGGMIRTEVLCSRCSGHLGHVFNDGPAPAKQRHCINSAALKFHAKP